MSFHRFRVRRLGDVHTHTYTYVVRPIYERPRTDRVRLAKILIRRVRCRPIMCEKQNLVAVHSCICTNSIVGFRVAFVVIIFSSHAGASPSSKRAEVFRQKCFVLYEENTALESCNLTLRVLWMHICVFAITSSRHNDISIIKISVDYKLKSDSC